MFSKPKFVFYGTSFVHLVMLKNSRRVFRVTQDLRPQLQDLIPEVILCQKYRVHNGRFDSGCGSVNCSVFIEVRCSMHKYSCVVRDVRWLFKEAAFCLGTYSDQRCHGTFVRGSCSSESSSQ